MTLQRLMSSTAFLSANQGKTTKYNTDQILKARQDSEFFNRRTKIVCTMGPSCWEVSQLVAMIEAGMSVARFNFSHGDHATHKTVLDRLHEAMKITGKQVGILLDTKGPEIRTGFFRDGGTITLNAGDKVKLVTEYDFKGDKTCFSCSYPQLPQSVRPGSTILVADGSLTLEVIECGADYVVCKAMNTATIGERKNMNLPNVKVQLPVCGPKEEDDIKNWGIPYAQFIAASFVQCADDIRCIRNMLGEHAKDIHVIAKIENVEGIINFDEIIREADGIMIARGDMGMEIPPEKVFLAQKMMIAKCNLAGKPVVTATQMLESMIKAPRPTRAEASDVANAVLDGTDCVMLSGESANGKFPVESVKTMARTCLEAESALDYPRLFTAIHSSTPRPISIAEAVCSSAVETAEDVDARLIVVVTESGSTARFVAKYKPPQRILALCPKYNVCGHLMTVRGVMPVHVESVIGTDEVVTKALTQAKQDGHIESGNTVVIVHGLQENVSGSTNIVKVMTCP